MMDIFFDINIFPSFQYNISGFLLTIFSIIVLFTLPVKIDIPITRRPIFWFCVAFVIFYPSQFILNGFINYIEKYKPGILIDLPDIVYFGLNYLLYILLIIGFLCLKQTKKFFIQ